MTVLVTDDGFQIDDWLGGYAPINEAGAKDAVDLASDFDPRASNATLLAAPMIRIDFPSFADGRGFTIAAQLRRQGFAGRLRAKGHIISDQYAMARRAGFDEVEIDQALAIRQPEQEWKFRADWRSHFYQNRLRAG